jgi:hypothetical protein
MFVELQAEPHCGAPAATPTAPRGIAESGVEPTVVAFGAMLSLTYQRGATASHMPEPEMEKIARHVCLPFD